ncbi:hypothetical protein ACP275_11G027000 [Erythranthe tilingii]
MRKTWKRDRVFSTSTQFLQFVTVIPTDRRPPSTAPASAVGSTSTTTGPSTPSTATTNILSLYSLSIGPRPPATSSPPPETFAPPLYLSIFHLVQEFSGLDGNRRSVIG